MLKRNLFELTSTKTNHLVAPLMGFPGAALTGTTIKENLSDSQKQLKSILALVDAVNPDIVMPMMDLSIECELLGLPIDFPENESPSVEGHPIKTPDDLKKLTPFNISPSNRGQVFLDTVKGLKQNTGAVVCAYVCGPFTLAGLLMGATDIFMASYDNPQGVKDITVFCTDIINTYSKTLEEHGADAICILDPTAVMLSPDTFAEFAGNYVSEVDKNLDIPTILHICGNTTNLIDEMVATGVQGLSLDMDIDIKEIIKNVPEDIIVMGNLDSKNLMPEGSSEEVKQETLKLLDNMKDFNNFIPSTGCDLPPETPIENIIAFSEAIQNFTCLDTCVI